MKKKRKMMMVNLKKILKSQCKPFMHGLVPTVISIIPKVLCRNTNAFAVVIKIQIINQWYYLILVVNTVKELGMKAVYMVNVIYYVILEAVLHAALLFQLHAIVVNKPIGSHVR